MPIPGAPPLLSPLDRALQKWTQVPVGEPEPFTGLIRTILHNSISNINSNFGTGSYVTSAFTPPNSSLLVAVCGAVEAAGNPPFGGDFAISGGGLTWTLQKSQLTTGTFTTGIFIYTAPVTTGSSMQITLSCNARDMGFYAATVLSYTNYNVGSPVGATGSDFLDAAIPGPPTPTQFDLNANPALTSEIVAGVSMDKNRADVTPGTGWQEISDYENFNWGGMQVQVRNNYGSTVVRWEDLRPTDNGSGALFNWADAAIEIKVASGSPDQNLTLGGITSSETLGALAVSVSVAVNGVPSSESVGQPTVTTTYTINAGGISSAEILGASPLTTTVTVAVNGITSSESVGNASVAQSVSASGIPTEQRVGSPTVSATYTMTPQGIVSSESVGNPSVATASSVLANGISSEQRLGSPAVTTTYTINAHGISTSERLGASSLGLTVPASGIESSEKLGNPSVTVITAINAGSIASSEQLGSPSITTTVTINAGGIVGSERVGSPNVATASTISAGGITSSERFGAAQVQPGAVTIAAYGAVSDSRVGFAQVSLGPLGLQIFAGSITSKQEVGFPHAGQQVIIDVVHVANIPITVWRESPAIVVGDDDDDDDHVIAITGEDDVEHTDDEDED